MAYDRRPERRGGGRPGGGRPGGGRPGGRPEREPRPRGYEGGRYERGGSDRGGSERGGYAGPARDREGFAADRPRTGGFRSRDDEGGMSIRLDPRRLSALKLLAAEAGVRPGELVTSWVEERLDAARAGRATGPGASAAALAELTARVDELARRMDEMANGTQAAEPAPASEPAPVSPREVEVEPGPSEESPGPPARRPRGRPRKAAADAERQAPAGAETVPGSRTPLHDEIAAVIRERGPMTAADIATAIGERGRYAPPRSSRPLDAATINSRVSNPAYRALFARDGRRIGLAETG